MNRVKPEERFDTRFPGLRIPPLDALWPFFHHQPNDDLDDSETGDLQPWRPEHGASLRGAVDDLRATFAGRYLLGQEFLARLNEPEPKYNQCSQDIAANLYRKEADGANIHQLDRNREVLRTGIKVFDSKAAPEPGPGKGGSESTGPAPVNGGSS